MKLCLIFPPAESDPNWSTLRAQDDHIGVMPPLSLAYVAAIAEKGGHSCDIIDVNAERLPFEEVIARIKNFGTDILGFTTMTQSFHQTLHYIKRIKARLPEIPVLVGGAHQYIYAKETLAHQAIDYILVGEAESNLIDFMTALEKKDGCFDGVQGVGYRKNGEVFFRPPSPDKQDFNLTPNPARHLLKNELYGNFLTKKKNFTVMLSTKGCPYTCIFCELGGLKYRARTAQNFFEEIQECVTKFGIREMDIYDSTFTIDRRKVMELCRLIIESKIQIRWTVRTRPDRVDLELLTQMHQAGCRVIMFGIESGNDAVLKALKKNYTVEKVRKAVSAATEVGIECLGFFVLGGPDETEATLKDTVDFARELDLDWVQFSKMTPFPNTELYKRYMNENGFFDYWSAYTIDQANERELPMVGTSLTPGKVKWWVKYGYLRFYLRPKIVFRRILRIESLGELFRYFRAALDMILEKDMC